VKKVHKKMLGFLERTVEQLVLDSSALDDKTENIDERLDLVESRMDTHSNTHNAIIRRIERLEKRLESKAELLLKLDPEVGSHAIRISNLEDRLHDMPRRFEEIERKLDALQRDTLDLRGKVARLIPPKGE